MPFFILFFDMLGAHFLFTSLLLRCILGAIHIWRPLWWGGGGKAKSRCYWKTPPLKSSMLLYLLFLHWIVYYLYTYQKYFACSLNFYFLMVKCLDCKFLRSRKEKEEKQNKKEIFKYFLNKKVGIRIT